MSSQFGVQGSGLKVEGRGVITLSLPGGKATESIRKHDHLTPARKMRRDVRALTARLTAQSPDRLGARRGSPTSPCPCHMPGGTSERDFFIDNLLVGIHVIFEMSWRTGLAPWEFEFSFPGSLISTLPGGGRPCGSPTLPCPCPSHAGGCISGR